MKTSHIIGFGGAMRPSGRRIQGFARTDGGRLVYDTGKVAIGLRHTARRPGQHAGPELGADAERIQTALLRPSRTRKTVTPSLIPLDNSLLARLARWVRNLLLKGSRP